MKLALQSWTSHEKLGQWIKLISLTGLGQMAVQAIGLLSGILIIRLLPTQEYALYTLTNTMLGTMTILADGGVSTGVMIQGSKVWLDREKLGSVLVTGFELRKKFGLVSLCIATPALLYLLLHHGASWFMSILIILSLIPAFFATLSDSLLEVGPKLHQDIIPLQKNGVLASIGRFVLVTLTIFIFPWAFLLIFGGSLPRIWANSKLRKLSVRYVDWNQQSDPIIQRNIVDTVKKLLPNSIYYCVSNQLSVWLISLFGSTAAVAQIGALSRISIVFSILSSLFQTLIVPRFSRLSSDRPTLLKWFVLLQLIMFVFAILATAVASVFSTDILQVLGSKYAGLEAVLTLSIISAVMSLAAGGLYGIMVSRNWIMNPILSISIGVAAQVVSIYFIDFSSIKGAYYFSINYTLIGMSASYLFVFILAKRQKLT